MTTVEAWSSGIVAGAAIACIALERVRPYNRGQPLVREGFWTDLVFYTIVQSYVLGVVIGRLIAWMGAHGWSSHVYVGRWPLAAQIALFLITHDIYIYFFHRLQHRLPLLWRIHEAHHSVRHVDWLAAARSHSLEILINQTIEFAPMILLHASPEVPVIKGAIGAVWGMFIHSNIDVRLGRLQYVINGPEMHRWHHADERDAYDRNFATKFAIWDWLFGTAFFPDRDARRAQRYGLGAAFPERFPLAYFQQHARAFRRGVAPEPPPDAAAIDGTVG